MCDDCGHDHEVSPETEAKLNEIIGRMKALDFEKRNILIDEITSKVKTMLETAIEEENPIKARMLMALANNSLNLIGMTNAETADDSGWTSTGDKVVSTIWNDWMHMIMEAGRAQIVPISTDDLPDDVVERLAAGERREEDMAIVRQAMKDAGSDIPDDAEFDFAGVLNPDGSVSAVSKPEQKEGIGLYL